MCKNVLRIGLPCKLAGIPCKIFLVRSWREKKKYSRISTRVYVVSTGLKTGLLYRFLFVTFSRYGILRIEFFFFSVQIETLLLILRERERKKRRTYVTMRINRDNFMYDFYYRGFINVCLAINYTFSK